MKRITAHIIIILLVGLTISPVAANDVCTDKSPSNRTDVLVGPELVGSNVEFSVSEKTNGHYDTSWSMCRKDITHTVDATLSDPGVGFELVRAKEAKGPDVHMVDHSTATNRLYQYFFVVETSDYTKVSAGHDVDTYQPTRPTGFRMVLKNGPIQPGYAFKHDRWAEYVIVNKRQYNQQGRLDKNETKIRGPFSNRESSGVRERKEVTVWRDRWTYVVSASPCPAIANLDGWHQNGVPYERHPCDYATRWTTKVYRP